MSKLKISIAAFLLASQLALSGPLLAANGAPATETESQQFARKRLLAMAAYLGDLDTFRVTLRAGYDVPQASGQMIEFGEIRTISVRRPGQARLEQRASDGKRDLMLFDGKKITLFDADQRVFAQTAERGDLDAAIKYLLLDLKMRLPLAPMLMAGFAAELEENVVAVDYVETTDILGPSADHIAARTDTMDFQVWIQAGEQPWPLRIVMTYPRMQGSPQYWSNFSDWDTAPDFGGETFVFDPPEDATRIPFAASFTTQPTGGKP